MALSERVDLTESGDFQAQRFRFARRESNNFPLTDLIERFYLTRNQRLRPQPAVQRPVPSSRTPFRSQGGLQLMSMDDLEFIIAKKEYYPWSLETRWYDKDHMEDELFYTGTGDLIRSKKDSEKHWSAHEQGLECEICGKLLVRTPWNCIHNACSDCGDDFEDHEREGFGREALPFTAQARTHNEKVRMNVTREAGTFTLEISVV